MVAFPRSVRSRSNVVIVIAPWTEASILGGGGGEGAVPNGNIGGGANIFRQLEKLIICNARIGLKSTVMHYQTIKFNIKIPLNIQDFHF